MVIGIAGSGKTTTLSAVRAGFETAGYTVVGTATSGQAAENLGEGAGIESRTIASLTWRIDHGTLKLTDRHVVICDEAGTTADVDLARLLGAIERAGAKLIVVGDDRQLDAVGPGGALAALAARHPERVWELAENLRQTDPGERAAVADLRHGDAANAVPWCADHGRIRVADSRARAVRATVRAWATDTAAGHHTLPLAYRRDNVDALNCAARQLWETAGLLSGPELTAPGGRRRHRRHRSLARPRTSRDHPDLPARRPHHQTASARQDQSAGAKPGRYRPPDATLAFLESL